MFENRLPKHSQLTSKQSFFTGLFSRNPWYPNLLKLNQPVENSSETPVVKVQQQEVKRAVESLHKIEEKEVNLNKLVEVPAAKNIKKEEPVVQASVAEISSSFEEYLSSMNKDWKKEEIPGFNYFENGKLKVLFYGLSEFEENEFKDLEVPPYSLVPSDQDLLGKMIGAMNLKEGSFLRCPQVKGDGALNHLLSAVSYFRPQVVVSLGAGSTNIALEKKVRLSNIHGEILPKSFRLTGENKTLEFYVSPLFHPNLLEINTSMKRTAWIDMQRVMKFLQENQKTE
ncbi:hypothetical protein M900_0668 [Bacteriovorax sp. Seq25_V]|nr:hypothetical protein M900_0668 [Bacteriovorax sp. Seq25_V]